MRNTLFLSLLLFAIVCRAQNFSSEVWHDGYAVTVEQDTIRGFIKYDMVSNIILVSRNNVVQSFSSHKVFYVQIFDKLVENYRQFYSIPYSVNFDYEVPILFEVLYEGPLSLLSREAITTETVNSASGLYGNSFMREVVNYSYYFLDKQGKIDFFSGRKADLLEIMAKKQSQITNFIKKNKMDTGNIRDLIRITAFYNSL
ncbi:MAG: hypothetical protein ACJA08_002515 [Cyclobacteriaceae bacterium]|jgi:hypothetical protein